MNSTEKTVLKVTLWSIVVNILLTVLKFLVGFMGKSSAMIADAAHSLSDIATDITVLLFFKIHTKPSDNNHNYGHGKYETLAVIIISIFLFSTGIGICMEGVNKIWDSYHGNPITQPSSVTFYIALLSILIKELMYRVTVIAGKKHKSSLLTSNAWHHRSDALSSIGVALGIGGSILLGEAWLILDPIAAIVVGILIIQVSFKIFIPGINELLEKALPQSTQKEILNIIQNVEGVKNPHALRTRKIGGYFAVDLHVYLQADLTIEEGHSIVLKVEEALLQHYPEIKLNIHVDPYTEI